jgi:hypothetical protein
MAVIRLRVNGRDHRVDVPPGECLPTVLRTELDLTAAQYGCGIDVVMVDRTGLPAAGAGETPIIGLAPAIANAWPVATSERRRSLPLAPPARRA